MRKTLLALAILAAGGLTIGAATTASAMQFNQAGTAGIVQPGANVQLAHGHGHHHGGFFRGRRGLFLVPLPGGGCYESCRYNHGPRYCHAQCGY
jgi:hypothetical protein